MSKEDRVKRTGPVGTNAESPKLPREASDAVAGRVRASYATLLEEPIPDKFLKLLDELDAASSGNGAMKKESAPEIEAGESGQRAFTEEGEALSAENHDSKSRG